jgi:GT2 family glycosyltransferase
MAKGLPLISVLVCNYNYGGYIKETLDSVLSQTYPNIEVVVVDDGSSDDSVGVIKKYIKNHAGVNITFSAKKKNQGICFARNDAIDLAKGDFLIFLDSDDTMPIDYVSVMYAAIIKQRADVVYGDVAAFGAEEYRTDYPKFDRGELIKRNYINVTSLMRRSALGGQRFDEKLNRKTHEDYDFWLGLSLKGLKFVKSENTFLNYRIQKSSRNANHLNMKERTREVVDVWKYSFEKYQKQFPGKLTQDSIFGFYDHQLSMLGDELMALNDVVQEELVPELKRRAIHIEYLNNKSKIGSRR